MVKKGRVVIKLDEIIGTINPNIYGHFVEHIGELIYPGIWVGEDSDIPSIGGIRKDLIEHLKKINPSVIRWPGGCFADLYHWQDGIGPKKKRPKRVTFWREEESNQFGTDEFLRFCSLVGAEPYTCLNVGSGSLEEARSWVEYCNYGGESYCASLRAKNGHPEPYRVKYWGIGNENWGCGGCFSPQDYASEYRRFANGIKSFALPAAKEWGDIELIACGHTTGSISDITRDWNRKLMEGLKDYLYLVDHLSIHHYFHQRTAIDFSDEEYYNLFLSVQRLENEIQQAISVVDSYTAGKKDVGIIVDEWGTWYAEANPKTRFRQQNTLRDALLAAFVFNLFNRYSRKVVMANIAQLVNILQALFLTDGDKLIVTPTYHSFDMYKHHMSNDALKVETTSPILKEAPPTPEAKLLRFPSLIPKPLETLDVSASINEKSQELVVTLVNLSLCEEIITEISLGGDETISCGTKNLLTAENVRSFNDFEAPERVKPSEGTIEAEGGTMIYSAPPHSVSTLLLKLE